MTGAGQFKIMGGKLNLRSGCPPGKLKYQLISHTVLVPGDLPAFRDCCLS